MTAQEFAYWLQGFFEMTDTKKLTPKQIRMIKKHLDLVFKNVTNNPLATSITITPQTVPNTSDQIHIPYIPYTPFNPPNFDWDSTVAPPWKLGEVICSDGKKY